MTELSQEEKLNAFLDKLHADLEKKKSELAAFLKEIERILALIAENEAKCLVIENTLTVTIPENIKALEAERDRHLAVLAELNAKLAILAEELNVLKEKKKVIEDKAAGVKTQILALEAEIAGMEGTVDSLYLSDDSPDHKANDEINKHFAIRDEIRARVKAHEDDIRRDRNTYDAVLISLANLEKAISLNERHIFKQNQIIETLEAEFALEKCTVDALQIASKIGLEEIQEMEKLKTQEIANPNEMIKSLNGEIEVYQGDRAKKQVEKEKVETQQHAIDPIIFSLEDEQQAMISVLYNTESELKATHNVFDSFFCTIYSFIINPSRNPAEVHFSGSKANNDKRASLKVQLSNTNQNLRQNTSEITTQKNKRKELRDIVYKHRNEITFATAKIEKNRNLQFVINKTEDQIQEVIDEKLDLIDRNTSIVNEKTAQNQARTNTINEARERLKQLEKENELKKAEYEKEKAIQESEQEKIIKSSIAFEKAVWELDQCLKELNQKGPETSAQLQLQRFDIERKMRGLYRQLKEKLIQFETLSIAISTASELVLDKKNEAKPFLNEKRLHLQAIAELEAAIQREISERERLNREKLSIEDVNRKLKVQLEDLYDKIPIWRLSIKSKEEVIELNQPLIPNITEHTRFY